MIKKIFINIAVGIISVVAVVTMVKAFTGPGLQPPQGNPIFWTKSGGDVYYPSGGNVSIGAVPTSYRLDVQGGQINSSGGLCIAGNCKTDWNQVQGTSYWTQSGSNLFASSTSWNAGVGTISPDSNYKLTLSGGGIKSENNSATQPAGYFSNAGGNAAILAGTGGISLGGVTKTSWPSGQWVDGAGGIIYYNGGNVGIGTAGPSSSFARTLHIANPTDVALTLERTGATTGKYSIGVINPGDFGIYDELNSAYRVYIKKDGNVGIGTTSPGTKLDVNGTARMTGFQLGTSATAGYVLTANASGVGTWQAASGGITGSGTTNYLSKFTAATVLGNSLVFDNGTNVGVGTASPGYKLDVNSSVDYYHMRLGGSGVPLLKFANVDYNSGNGAELYQNDAGTFIINTNSGTGAIAISATGNVGIGTASPGYKLDVSGSFNATTLYIAGVQKNTVWDAKEPAIAAGTTGQYFRGDKTWQTLPSAGVSSVFGRTGAVIAASGDYTAAQVGLGNVTNESKATMFTSPTFTGNVALSGGNITGIGKITANSIDPVFKINGKNYATWVSDFAGGLRVDTSGVLKLDLNYEIDFNNLNEGSDLWLFWQTSNKNINDLSIILTPGFDGKVWYEKGENKIIIHTEKSGEISYRLSAPRIDYKDGSNLAEDQLIKGIDVLDYQK